MAKGKFVKMQTEVMASELFENRPGNKVQVLVRSLNSQQGYWGRGWAVQNAIRAAAWLGQGEAVGLALCTKDTVISGIGARVERGKVGQWYKGRIMSNRDIKVTHMWVEEKAK